MSVGAAKRSLAIAERNASGRTDLAVQVSELDLALAPRISAAVEQQPAYIIDTLGPRPASNAQRWDRAATTIEQYRHAVLGFEPHAGPISTPTGSTAIGNRPLAPLANVEWADAKRSIQDARSLTMDSMDRRRG